MGLAVLVLGSWALAAALTGDAFTGGRLGIYIAPHLMIVAAILAVLAMLVRAWLSAAVAGLVAACLFALFAPQLLRGAPDPATLTGGGVITVMTHSVRGGAAEAFLRAHPADVIALQEVEDAEVLIAQLDDLYGTAPLYHCRHEREVILSRFPVSQPDEATKRWQVFCEVALPGGPALVASLHMPKARWQGAAQQLTAFNELAGVIDAETRPMILMGDFNTTPLTTPYALLSTRLKDAFAAMGRGLGATFPTPARPLLGRAGGFLAIDHVFTSPSYRVMAAEVLSSYAAGADHFPVRAVLRPGGS